MAFLNSSKAIGSRVADIGRALLYLRLAYCSPNTPASATAIIRSSCGGGLMSSRWLTALVIASAVPRISCTPLMVGVLLASGALPSQAQDRFATERQHMVREIESIQLEVSAQTGQRTLDPRVIAAIGKVPRHQFVRKELEGEAYANRPLPIGHGQTISQPYIVAIMTDLLATKPGDRVLELGTGSGYQAAVLAELVREVYTIEIIEPLANEARQRLAQQGLRNVQVKLGD